MTESSTSNSQLTPLVDLDRVNQTLRTIYRSWILRSPEEGPRTLLELLHERLPHISTSSWPERLEFGGVYINGLEALHDQVLPLPVRVEYYEPKFEIAAAPQLFPAFKEEYILFQDGMIAIVYKPPHLSSMPAKEQRHFSLKASLEKHFQRAIHMPSRLDVSAQGIIAVSISEAAHGGLQRAFETRTVSKTYRCATRSRREWTSKTVDSNIAQSPFHPVLRTTSHTEGQSALTRFSFSHSHFETAGECSVYNAHPITGRTHQIRVHAAASGIPLLGDNFYGGEPASYLHLVSYEISFAHPVTGTIITQSLPDMLAPSWAISPRSA